MMKIQYRVCDICGQNMDLHDYYTLKIDCKSQKRALKSDWSWRDICDECKTEIEKLLQSRTKRIEIKLEEEK